MECPECDAPVRDGGRFCMSCGAVLMDLRPVAAMVMPERWVAAHSDRPGKQPTLHDHYLGTASRIPRLIAWIIDSLLVGGVTFFLIAVFGLEIVSLEVSDDPYFGGEAYYLKINWDVWIAVSVFQAAYFIVFPATHWMATPGKRMFALRVTDASGDRIGLVQSTWRYACQWFVLGVICPIALVLVPFGLGLIAVPVALWMVLASNHEQSPWDMLAGTRVLE
jgi:uncharacterized RDD family membrane protein YckC